jgi:magnesium-transporting ATPase (P-type)
MIIDDGVLTQAYATVLAGAVIFLTLQRRFEYEEVYEVKSNKFRLQRDNLREEIKNYGGRLNSLLKSRDKNLQAAYDRFIQPEYSEPFEAEKNSLEGLISMKNHELTMTQTNWDSLTRKYLKRRQRYHRLKSGERFFDVIMLVFMAAAIVIVLVGIYPPYEKAISIIVFSIGIIALIGRVYLYSEELSEEKVKKEKVTDEEVKKAQEEEV